MTMKALADAPDNLLFAFRVDATSGDVRWAWPNELAMTPLRKEDGKKGRKLPFGKLAGSKRVLGHGRLVLYAGRQLLTMDIAAGRTWFLPHIRFPWSSGTVLETGDPSPDDAHHLATALSTWSLDDAGKLVWRIAPHSTIAAGAPALGVKLAGRGDNALTFRGVVYVSSDVEHALERGRWPWQPDWD